MLEPDPGRVKRVARQLERGLSFGRKVLAIVEAERLPLGAAVKLVADDRMPGGLEVHADLVLSARRGKTLGERVVARDLEPSKPGKRRLGAIGIVRNSRHLEVDRGVRG